MREDKDFKPSECSDGSIIYTNLEKICAGLPEWGDIYCSICHEKFKHDPDDGDANFYRFDIGKDIWYKFFHGKCKPTQKQFDDVPCPACEAEKLNSDEVIQK